MFSSISLKDRVRELEIQVSALQRELANLHQAYIRQERLHIAGPPKFRETHDENQASQARVERPE